MEDEASSAAPASSIPLPRESCQEAEETGRDYIERQKERAAKSTRGLGVVSCPDWMLARGRRSPFTGNSAASRARQSHFNSISFSLSLVLLLILFVPARGLPSLSPSLFPFIFLSLLWTWLALSLLYLSEELSEFISFSLSISLSLSIATASRRELSLGPETSDRYLYLFPFSWDFRVLWNLSDLFSAETQALTWPLYPEQQHLAARALADESFLLGAYFALSTVAMSNDGTRRKTRRKFPLNILSLRFKETVQK